MSNSSKPSKPSEPVKSSNPAKPTTKGQKISDEDLDQVAGGARTPVGAGTGTRTGGTGTIGTGTDVGLAFG
jgi:hypothetical protein